jgi:hypothetical protein
VNRRDGAETGSIRPSRSIAMACSTLTGRLKQKPSPLLAAGADQEVHLRFGLHAFRDHIETELVREPDCSADLCGVAVVDGDAEHELLRKLQPVHRIPGEIFERRIAGPEIVDGDLDSQPGASSRALCHAAAWLP